MLVPPSKRKSALSISCTTHIVQDGMSSTISVLLPILAQAFGFSYAEVGTLKGVMSISQAVFELGSGWLSKKIGECQLIVVGLALSGAGYFLLSAAPSTFLVALCLMIIGVGTALHHAPSSALIANNYPSANRSSALGFYNASGDVGKLVFTGGISLATGAGFAWQQISLFYAIVAILAAAAIGVATRTLLRLQREAGQEEPDDIDQPETKGWGILNWRSFGALLAVSSIDTMVQSSVIVFMAFLMIAKGLPLSIATGATVLLLAGGIFGKAGCGYLADRMGVRPSFVLIQTLTALGLIAVVVAPNWLAFALLMPLGAAVQGTSSITYGMAANLIDHRKMANGYALLYSAGSFMAAAGPLAIGVVADTFGIETAIYIIAILSMLAIPPIFAMRVGSAHSTRLT